MIQPPTTLERRVAMLEARFNELEITHGATLYELRRFAVRTDLNMGKILDHLGLTPATEQEIDAVLDQA